MPSGSEPAALPEPEPPGSAGAIAAAARAQERERMCQILDHPEARGREGLALHLATKSEMSPEEAVQILKLAPLQSGSATGPLALMSRATVKRRGNDA